MNINDSTYKEKVKEFCKSAGKSLATTSEYLIEKDLYLTIILKELQKTEFHKNLVFKGGTCLAKAYLNYHRFSEDLDFTWKSHEILKGKSMKQIRKICSGHINKIGKLLVEISEKYLFDFKFEKHNRAYVQLGGSSKMATFILWFDSAQGRRSMIKIQVNFMEDMEFPVEKKKLNPPAFNFPDNERVYFKEFLEFYDDLDYYVYDIKEIASEKIRALLTRKTAKVKDLFDLYFIQKKFGVDAIKLKKEWIKKIRFAIDNYKKYGDNFKTRIAPTKDDFVLEDIDYLLLAAVDKEDFNTFVTEFLNKLENETNTVFNKQRNP